MHARPPHVKETWHVRVAALRCASTQGRGKVKVQIAAIRRAPGNAEAKQKLVLVSRDKYRRSAWRSIKSRGIIILDPCGNRTHDVHD